MSCSQTDLEPVRLEYLSSVRDFRHSFSANESSASVEETLKNWGCTEDVVNTIVGKYSFSFFSSLYINDRSCSNSEAERR